ncbi:MAG: NADP-dependent glyceraldehyde-3-phosphate dehydrogenase, partial [Methylomonas sp.]
MTPNENSISIFPQADLVPTPYRIESPIEQRQYLIDGVIKEWTGPLQDVLSPICETVHGGMQR